MNSVRRRIEDVLYAIAGQMGCPLNANTLWLSDADALSLVRETAAGHTLPPNLVLDDATRRYVDYWARLGAMSDDQIRDMLAVGSTCNYISPLCHSAMKVRIMPDLPDGCVLPT